MFAYCSNVHYKFFRLLGLIGHWQINLFQWRLQINRPVNMFIQCVNNNSMALSTVSYQSKSLQTFFKLAVWRYIDINWLKYLMRLINVDMTDVARLPKLWRDCSGRLWRGYKICGEITCGELTLWWGYSHSPKSPVTKKIRRNKKAIPELRGPDLGCRLWVLYRQKFSLIFGKLNCIGLPHGPKS